MPVIGGMTSWVGPIIGAVLLGTIQQLATVTISSALNLLIVGLLLIVFVIIAPNGIVGLVQARRRAREERLMPAAPRPILDVSGFGQAFRRVCRARKHRLHGRARRAARADRPQRFGQEHARQLPLRHIAPRDRQRRCSTAVRSTG